MATKKSKDSVVLTEELTRVVGELASKSKASGGVLTEDDIQIAVKEIDVDSDELSALYDAVRERGIEITTASAEAIDVDMGVSLDDFVDEDDAFVDEDEDDEEVRAELANEVRGSREIPSACISRRLARSTC